jgi:hypothetical protein
MKVFPNKDQLLIIISDRKDISQKENYDMIFDFLHAEREVIDITVEHCTMRGDSPVHLSPHS